VRPLTDLVTSRRRSKRELREQIEIDREGQYLRRLENQERSLLSGLPMQQSGMMAAAVTMPTSYATQTPPYAIQTPPYAGQTPYYPAGIVPPPSHVAPPFAQAMAPTGPAALQNSLSALPGYGAPPALEQMEAQLQAQMQYVHQLQRISTTGAMAGCHSNDLYHGGAAYGTHTPGIDHGALNQHFAPHRRVGCWSGQDGTNFRITTSAGGAMPARYAGAVSGTSSIDPVSDFAGELPLCCETTERAVWCDLCFGRSRARATGALRGVCRARLCPLKASPNKASFGATSHG
jgi:hypothetical protein